MLKQIVLIFAITCFFISAVLFSYLYGPDVRSFTSSPKILAVESTEEIFQAWETSHVKGRVAICFTRYLNSLESLESKGLKTTELSMQKGILRKVFHIPPDNSWPEISEELSKRNYMRPTVEGFIGIFNYGRAYIMPLSKFTQVTEKALVIVEPKVWTSGELTQIAEKLQSGKISSDLLVVIRGSEKDAELLRQVMARGALQSR